ncbi:HEAT repeat containing 9 [Desmophyllum pertusum]|uniref:HEAT repeat containing 9 n=1 Tax=Desmophyllum pertusum TaxID=174260 RepID=A0A9W9Z7V6_9CNID|nr:HEAT repeat containing 9 [Desmophyllum pertusum]
MNCKDKLVVDALLQQLSTAHNWKLRMEAADLLIFIGARDVFKVISTDEVFDTLERLLWDHANKELRSKVSDAISSLDLRQRACQLVLRRLEDPAEEVRGRAVISLATLEMKGVKEMKALLDILELDSSVYVRIQVVRAFSHMEWNDPRILRSLREREKGEGTLATEARKLSRTLSDVPAKRLWSNNLTPGPSTNTAVHTLTEERRGTG